MMRPSQRNRLRRTAAICLVLLTSIVGLSTATAQPAQQAPGPHVSSSPNGLVINEVADSQTPAQEYFELYNTGATNINLSTYVIYDHDGNTPLSTLDDTNIAPGQIRAIGPSQLHVPQIGATGLARTDFLGLVNTSPSDVVIDVVNWGNAPDISWPNYDRFASYFFVSDQPQLPQDGTTDIQRWPDGYDTDQGSDWQVITRSPGTFSCDDPYESDNDLQHAVNQNINTTTEHRLCPAADSDFTAISMSSAYTYTLFAQAIGTSVDLATRLYDTSGNIIVEDNPPGTRNSTINFRPSTDGIYKVQIYDANNGGNSGPLWLYRFTITQQAVPTATPTISTSATPTLIGCNDPYEPDNNISQAKNIDLNTEQVHTLCQGGTTGADVDFVRFAVNGGKVYTLYTKDLSGPVDTVITLYDSAGHAIDENDDCSPGQGLYSCLNHVFPGTGVYYLRIRDKRGLNGAAYQYTVGFSSTGELPPTGTPTVTPTENPNSPTPTTGPCEDAYEPDGVPENASLILINDPNPQHHSICPEGDADWVRFYARAGKEYTIQTSNLGPGLDTFMFLFDSDMTTILAQNDDGGNGLASRIDFFPQRDDWYYVQIKNAGDLGLPEMSYDLSLSVVPGVPQPPGTATPIIAPIETVTGEPNVPTPTTLVQATNPPLPTPTEGSIPPTPAAESIQSTPSAKPTDEVLITQGQPPLNTPAKPTVATVVPTRPVEQPQPTQAPVQAAPTAAIPGVPDTGNKAPVIVAGAANGVQPPSSQSLAPMLFRVFYDGNKNDTFDTGEGIRGIGVYFLDTKNNLAPTGSLTTSQSGSGNVVQIPLSPQRVYVPYFDLSLPLTHFPERELHSLWLPPVQLPTSVP